MARTAQVCLGTKLQLRLHGRGGARTSESFLVKGGAAKGEAMADILVIDDEESVRFSFHRFLTAEKHSVATAACYRNALSQMNRRCFDLIIADMHLPDGWGIDILNEVAQRNLTTRVIIITAYPCNETIKKGLGIEAIDYLIKPLRQQALIHSVNNALRLS